MKLELKRIAKRQAYTIGRLSVDGAPFCDTLEDAVRDLSKEPKVPGFTAIPAGEYAVTLDVVSAKFMRKTFYRDNANGGRLPRLLGVPHFSGILIHCGNSAADTEGCILVGRNTEVGRLTGSQSAFIQLYKLLGEAHRRGERITIRIS